MRPPTNKPNLSVVIHTEEEFDWNGGFYPTNNQVSHGKELIVFCEKMLAIGAKVTFAMDYAFVNSEQGQEVINHFLPNQQDTIEFAAHLHPWVNPPIKNEQQPVPEAESYPGNLPKAEEKAKLQVLTQKITELCGQRPQTYLAGRYGVGPNTEKILQELGYTLDVSISPFSNYAHQAGPNFDHFNNDIFYTDGLCHWPHTTAVLAKLPSLVRQFDKTPTRFAQSYQSFSGKLLNKLARVKRQRLSPEGFELSDLQNIVRSQSQLDHQNFILSFHSPSVKQGMTPYVSTASQLLEFEKTTLGFLQWFKNEMNGNFMLANSITTKDLKRAS